MKQIRSFLCGMVACGMVMAFATNLLAENAQQGSVKVINIKGSARYIAGPNTTWMPLHIGAILKPGTIIQTASDSYVDLALNNEQASGTPLSAMSASGSSAPGSPPPPAPTSSYQPKAHQDAIRVFENTVLGIDKMTIDQTGADTVTETQLDLKAGSIFGSVKKLSAASKYEIKIPNGVAGIRGTIFSLSADGKLSLLSGSIVLAYVSPDGTVMTQVVSGGQSFDAHSGQLNTLSGAASAELTSTAAAFAPAALRPNWSLFFMGDMTVNYVSPTLTKK
jgi:hypothetical protein